MHPKNNKCGFCQDGGELFPVLENTWACSGCFDLIEYNLEHLSTDRIAQTIRTQVDMTEGDAQAMAIHLAYLLGACLQNLLPGDWEVDRFVSLATGRRYPYGHMPSESEEEQCEKH